MNYTIKASTLSGTIQIPSSKSHTHRALIFALLAKGKSTISKYLDSPDSATMLKTIQQLGAKVQKDNDQLVIEGVGPELQPAEDVINAGNSGIVLQFIGALVALIPTYTVITGDHSIRTRRPVKPLLEALKQLGVLAETMLGNGYAPKIIKGPLNSGVCTLDGQDSQPVSALLIATSFAKGSSEIRVTNPGEKPWIDLTLSWFDFLKLPYENHDYTHYKIPGGASYSGFHYTVPGDFSSLAFPVAAALITQSEISIDNVDMDDIQGDKKLLDLLEQMGAKFEKRGRTLHIKKSGLLQGKTFDINDTIDAITILAVIGCYAEGETVLTNAAVARKKECNRIHCIATELKKMGADIRETGDGLIIRTSKLKGTTLETYHDHRMVMSLTVAALGAEGKSVIHNAKCAHKTYPNFKEHLIKLGARVK
ncbi:MAG: 3-phosphoshikimate 1-carboxyvinyltransferase [Candidatus Neptunochlamydia sp.]|nr:3-phosphoshikimate 1-carboxyvinyltransferase [Candidatus Neptunochlamydia sp.]